MAAREQRKQGDHYDRGEQRDQRAVHEFIERFAGLLTASGMPPMPSRVFAALLATDSGRLTAAELADTLRVSPAAISGAVRYLAQIHIVVRERGLGARRDHYRVLDDVWYEATMARNQVMDRFSTISAEGAAALGPDTPAGARVNMARAYFDFMLAELPGVQERWEKRKAQLLAEGRLVPETPPIPAARPAPEG